MSARGEHEFGLSVEIINVLKRKGEKTQRLVSFLTVEKISSSSWLSMFLLPSEKSKSFLLMSSHHVGVLVLQLVQLFALLPQEQDSINKRHNKQIKVCTCHQLVYL